MKITLKNISLLKITNLNSTYGGNQSWFKERKIVNGGCGIVCACDILCYLSLTKDDFPSLYDFKNTSVTKEFYLNYMNTMKKFIKPISLPFTDINLLGVPFTIMYRHGIKKYMNNLKSHINFNIYNKDSNIIYFLESALKNNKPIAVLNWQNKKLKGFQFHWMTVVGLTYIDGKYVLDCLSWGNIYKVDLEDILNPTGLICRYEFLYIQ